MRAGAVDHDEHQGLAQAHSYVRHFTESKRRFPRIREMMVVDERVARMLNNVQCHLDLA